VHLTGRTRATLDDVADRIREAGGVAHVDVLDVVDRDAVERHAAAVADRNDGIDICFNATFNDDIQGTPLVDMSLDDLMQPVAKAVTSIFTMVTAPARHMVDRGTGVILVMGGGREAIPARRLPCCLGRARRPVPPTRRRTRTPRRVRRLAALTGLTQVG
jgi:NADP-dependent 3-hydroxy acid dehydrogenase YdfG